MIFVSICFSYGCNLVLIKYLAGQFWELSLGAHLSTYLGFKLIFYFRDMAYLDDAYILLYWSLLYSAILRSWADSLRSHVILHEWIAFYSAFLNIHRSGVLTVLAWLVPQESAARESQSQRVLCTPYNHEPCHFMQSHIRKVYSCAMPAL